MLQVRTAIMNANEIGETPAIRAVREVLSSSIGRNIPGQTAPGWP
jgi:hypothetical protein